VVVGGGQAGIAMSEHLGRRGIGHVVLERHRIAERWRTERWDTLVANGPAWHDRFPGLAFADVDPGGFAGRDSVVAYFEAYARQIDAPIRCGTEVTAVTARPGGGFLVETSGGTIAAANVVAATGPFQRPLVPPMIPEQAHVLQLHSSRYRNPDQLPEGAVLVVGAGSSGAQIADELQRAGRRVHLAVGPHQRPPRRYRGKDFCWWLGVLGHWDRDTPGPGMEHVTIAVSGARGGHTVDFREFASRGMTLLGRVEGCTDGVLRVAPDLAANIAGGDASYLSLLEEADSYAAAHDLGLPEEPEARIIGPDPGCVTDPILELDLVRAGIRSVVWATGYALDFGWLKLNACDSRGRPVHDRGVSPIPGLYFVGLPWLSRRASSFIWGVWHDADFIAGHIAELRAVPAL
jgi:putative flavoprotein involved in K+ transport